MHAILFVPLLAGTWMFGFGLFCLASDYFLSIVESSANGTAKSFSWSKQKFRSWMRDGINWPDNTFLDAFCKGFYLGFLVLLVFGPAVALGRLLAGGSPWGTLIGGSLVWFFFPIAMLSALMGTSGWTPFWPPLLASFAKRPAQTFAFYLFSIPILGLIITTFDLIILRTGVTAFGTAMALAPVAAVCFFVYARLLGRFGLTLSYTHPGNKKGEPDKPKPRKKKSRKPQVRPQQVTADDDSPSEVPEEEPDQDPRNVQPTDMPPVETPEGLLSGYGVDFRGNKPLQEEVKPKQIIHRFDDEDDEPIVVAPPPPGNNKPLLPDRLLNPPAHELKYYLREKQTEPNNPYGPELVTFFFDTKTIGAWGILTLGLMLFAILQRLLDMLRPE